MTDALAQRLRSIRARVIGVHLPYGPQRDAVVLACRAAGKAVVGLDSSPDVIVTADGACVEGVVRPLKQEVDEAVPGASLVLVLRLVGDVPLAPTLDAYLDVEMIEGRDVWIEAQVGASG